MYSLLNAAIRPTPSYARIGQQILRTKPSFYSFSSEAVAIVEQDVQKKQSTSKRRRGLDPIVVTDNAAARIKELLSSESASGSIGIRLGVKRRGCNGLSYTLNYAFEKPENDEELETHGIKVFIEPMALFSVIGTTMDFEENELASEFTFNNPNSKGECGCGESFNV
eukprot:CAMPEP_0195529786 /NCGR_PEP_ID=MMETSP0794_2-20130614/32431_1 /TAXON_ID=515487 /ORGANISM="Stephanopyxis turris, Strain CCMP 815" /LENGTH=166 /DNA_ID=CAMNT_0040661145 /DNA_START=74 /DNA_END=574 /DNA_ORIENTATION=+